MVRCCYHWLTDMFLSAILREVHAVLRWPYTSSCCICVRYDWRIIGKCGQSQPHFEHVEVVDVLGFPLLLSWVPSSQNAKCGHRLQLSGGRAIDFSPSIISHRLKHQCEASSKVGHGPFDVTCCLFGDRGHHVRHRYSAGQTVREQLNSSSSAPQTDAARLNSTFCLLLFAVHQSFLHSFISVEALTTFGAGPPKSAASSAS